MSPRLAALALGCLPTLALATPRLLDDDVPRTRHAWLLAQAPAASPAVSAEVAAIDQRLAEVLRDRPSSARVSAGRAITVVGTLVLVGGATSFFVFWAVAGRSGLGALLIGVPLMVVGFGLMLAGIIVWATSLSVLQSTDEEVARLRERREALLNAPPPTPTEPGPYIPQVWRGPAAPFTVARF